jgi:hypothetical protein
MATGRETRDLFFYLKRKDWKSFRRHLRQFDKQTYLDTFMPFVCKIKGHKPYVTIDCVSDINSQYVKQEAYACERCFKFLKDYEYNLPGLTYKDTLFLKYLERNYCKSGIEYNIVNGDLIYFTFEKYLLTNWSFEEYKSNLLHRIKKYLKSRLIGFQIEQVPFDSMRLKVKFSFIPSDYIGDYEMLVSYNEEEDRKFNEKFKNLTEENELKLSYQISE